MTTKDNSMPFITLSGSASDGYSTKEHATASCVFGSVQIDLPTSKPGLFHTFICNCFDCRKITASMFASNFIVADEYIKYIRVRNNMTAFAKPNTIATKNTMTNYFCKTCE